ncbi:prenyltransferase [Haloplanus halobius]|uniref:prenyltransferase n=1 Tax=Haloplanus halobius TaxID=2934938 RepID=UPI00200E2015|nr:prenyltransferase [Haloplanus sp. XH21]
MSLAYLVRLSRPRFWLYLAGPVAVGVVYGATAPADLLTPATLVLFAYFLLPANVLLYGVNDIFDADIDAENPKKEGREVRYGGGRLVPIAVTVSALLAFPPLAVTPTRAWPWLLGFLALGVAYSAPPLRLKTRPPLDSLSNGLYILPGVAAYVTVAGAQPPVLAVGGGWVWSMAMHTFSAIPDIDPDRAAGIETTATRLGERRAYAYCAGCWALAAIAFGLLDPRLGALMAVYPVAVVLVARADISVSRAYWWYPAVNTVVGALFTMGGLWRVFYG